MKPTTIFVIALIVGILGGILGAFIINLIPPTQEDLIKDFYDVETAVYVSPHGYRKHMADSTAILVDLRSPEEYEREHIIGAINIPAYKDPDTSAYSDVERIVSSFRTLEKENPNVDIIVYCYSIPCMTGRKIGKMLSDHGIYVKELGVGWNEWRYFWTLWNHEHEWNKTDVSDYIHSGPEPGTPPRDYTTGCDIEGDFGC